MASSIIVREPTESVARLFGTSDLLEARPTPPWKRIMDIVGASILLVLLSPVLVIISLIVMIDSPGGPIFRQTRVGVGGRCFTCWKFRSMRRGSEKLLGGLMGQNEANGLIFKIKDDPRRTRVGRVLRRTSIDELPQLWCVLRGSMSLVGPRPPLVSEVLRYDERALERLTVAPGITGLWQVTLRGRHDFADMVMLDSEYARTRSFGLDLRILVKTLPTVLFGHGSY